jgi:outer membrane protein assembly factor BamB
LPAAKQGRGEPEELDLAPLDEETKPSHAARPKPPDAQQEPPKPGQGPGQEPGQGPPALPSPLAEELPPLDDEQGAAAGPLDGLMADPMAGGVTGGLSLRPLRSKKRSLRKRWKTSLKGLFKRKEVVQVKPVDPKKVKLLVIAWVTAALLIVGAIVLISCLVPPGADNTLAAAQKAYDDAWAAEHGPKGADDTLSAAQKERAQRNYAQAVEQYTSFLQRFPEDKRASEARVRRALARIRLAMQKPNGGAAALKVAQEVVKKIEPEKAFQQSQVELALILMDIAEELSNEIRQHPDQALGEQARQAMGLMEDYIPDEARPTERVAQVTALLTKNEHEVNRSSGLDDAVAEIGEAVAKKNLSHAYELYRTLVTEYPEVIDDEKLANAMQEVSRAQQALVKTVSRAELPAAVVARPGVAATVVLALRNKTAEAPDGLGRIVVATARGAAFGLDAATGKVLWRRLVAREPNPPADVFAPLRISQEPQSDVLVVDAAHEEVWRVEGASGRVVWRQVVGEPLAGPPVIAGKLALVATRSGRLVMIELAAGKSAAWVQLPQSLGVAPAYDPQRSLVFQVAKQSNLYVISLPDGRCRQVVHLGHQSGAVAVPPVVAGNFLVVAENNPAGDFTLRALAIQASPHGRPAPALKPVEQVPLKGRISSPLAAQGQRLLAVTSRRVIYVYDLAGDRPAAPLVQVAQHTLTGPENENRFAVLDGDSCWIADVQLAEYEIRPAEGRLAPRLITGQDSIFPQPPLLAGKTVFYVRRGESLPGTLVSALDTATQNDLWQTSLATPLAAEPLPEAAGGKLTAVTAVGAMFEIASPQPRSDTFADQPLLTIPPARLLRPIGHVIAMSGGMFAMTSGTGSNQLVLFDPQQRQRYRWLLVPPPNIMTCLPIPMAGGLLAPCKSGQIFLLDPQSTGSLAEPFEPELKAGLAWNWRRPAALGAREAVISDGDRRLYRLGIVAQDDGKPRLAAGQEAKSPKPIASPLAVAGSVAYAIDDAGTLRSFELPSLAEGKTYKLPGGCAWGPLGVGNRVMLVTDNGRLLCFGDRQDLLWQVDLPYGPLAGPPWATAGQFIMASQSGVVWRVNAATGKELSKVETASPLGTGPVALGNRLFVGSHDGCIYEVEMP